MGVKLPIYMDNHATTPVDPRVVERREPQSLVWLGRRGSR